MLIPFEDREVAAVTPIMKVYKPHTLLQHLQYYEYTLSAFMKKLMSHIDCIFVTPGPFSVYKKSVSSLKYGLLNTKNSWNPRITKNITAKR